MNNVVKLENTQLTLEERKAFEYHSQQIKEGIDKGQKAKNIVISNVLAVLESNPPLWRENYSSEEDYVKTELNIEMSSFWRNVRDNKNYLYLISNTDDLDEQITLSRMRGVAYRELRQLATDNKSPLKTGGESEEDYKKRLREKEETDNQLVGELWKEVYPRVVKFKKQSNTGIYPTGGYSITAKDITETCVILQQIYNIPKQLNEGVDPSQIAVSTIDGKDMSLKELTDGSGERALQVLDTIADLSISEGLSHKLQRQSQYIKDSLEKKYSYDQYVGNLLYEDNRLKISNQYGKYDLLEELSDLLGKETSISVRRDKL